MDVTGLPDRRTPVRRADRPDAHHHRQDRRALRDHTLVIVTTDHGGQGYGHSDPRRLADYRIPFLVWGPGVASGRDLYALNADQAYADPGTRRVGYAAPRQPVRNGDVANLVLDVLGLPAVPESELDAAQDLEVLAD